MMKRFAAIFIAAVVGVMLGSVLFAKGEVPILAYHQVSNDDDIYSVKPEQFRQQMKFLAEHGYTPVSLHEVIEAQAGKGSLPDKPIVITFDDGYADNFTTALPIMEEYGMRATVFVIANAVGTPDYLTWEQIAAMTARHTEIGSHTYSHVDLSTLPPEKQREELTLSKTTLEAKLGRPIEFLAYPYGQFNAATQQLLAETGYRAACTGIIGLNTTATPRYALHRINMPQPKYGEWEFMVRLWRAKVYSVFRA